MSPGAPGMPGPCPGCRFYDCPNHGRCTPQPGGAVTRPTAATPLVQRRVQSSGAFEAALSALDRGRADAGLDDLVPDAPALEWGPHNTVYAVPGDPTVVLPARIDALARRLSKLEEETIAIRRLLIHLAKKVTK